LPRLTCSADATAIQYRFGVFMTGWLQKGASDGYEA
jgi:hypothetical protein